MPTSWSDKANTSIEGSSFLVCHTCDTSFGEWLSNFRIIFLIPFFLNGTWVTFLIAGGRNFPVFMGPRWQQLYRWHTTNLCWNYLSQCLRPDVTDYGSSFSYYRTHFPKGKPLKKGGQRKFLSPFSSFKNCRKLLSSKSRDSNQPSGKCFLHHRDKHI